MAFGCAWSLSHTLDLTFCLRFISACFFPNRRSLSFCEHCCKGVASMSLFFFYLILAVLFISELRGAPKGLDKGSEIAVADASTVNDDAEAIAIADAANDTVIAIASASEVYSASRSGSKSCSPTTSHPQSYGTAHPTTDVWPYPTYSIPYHNGSSKSILGSKNTRPPSYGHSSIYTSPRLKPSAPSGHSLSNHCPSLSTVTLPGTTVTLPAKTVTVGAQADANAEASAFAEASAATVTITEQATCNAEASAFAQALASTITVTEQASCDAQAFANAEASAQAFPSTKTITVTAPAQTVTVTVSASPNGDAFANAEASAQAQALPETVTVQACKGANASAYVEASAQAQAVAKTTTVTISVTVTAPAKNACPTGASTESKLHVLPSAGPYDSMIMFTPGATAYASAYASVEGRKQIFPLAAFSESAAGSQIQPAHPYSTLPPPMPSKSHPYPMGNSTRPVCNSSRCPTAWNVLTGSHLYTHPSTHPHSHDSPAQPSSTPGCKWQKKSYCANVSHK